MVSNPLRGLVGGGWLRPAGRAGWLAGGVVAVMAAVLSVVVLAVSPASAEPVTPTAYRIKAADNICLTAGETCAVGDVDGDGRADGVEFRKSTAGGTDEGDVFVSLSGFVAASGSTADGTRHRWSDWACIGEQFCHLADVNGDRKDDVVIFTREPTRADEDEGDVWVALSNGSGFGPGQKWQDWDCIWSQTCLVGDVSGDGKADTVVLNQSTLGGSAEGDVWVALSTGTSFAAAGSLWSDWACVGQQVCRLADVNGDGKSDLVQYTRNPTRADENQGDVYVYLSTGTGFSPAVKWSDFMCVAQEFCALGDINGDGKADAVAFIHGSHGDSTDGDVWVAMSTGTGFGAPFIWATGICSSAGQTCAMGDVVRDGNADAVGFVQDTLGKQAGDMVVAVAARMAAPTLNSVAVSGSAVTVTFTDQSEKEETFQVVRWDPVTRFAFSIATLTSTSKATTGTIYTVTDTITAGARVCYEIHESNSRGDGNYSADVCTTGPALPAPPASGFGVISTPDTNTTVTGVYSTATTGTDGRGITAYRTAKDLSGTSLRVAHCDNVNCTTVTTHDIDTLPFGNVGAFPSIKIGGDGLPIISYIESSDGSTQLFDLKVAHCVDVVCSSATVTTVDSAATVEDSTALTIGQSGFADIAYVDESPVAKDYVDIKLLHCQNAACTSFVSKTVDTVLAATNGFGTSGRVAIAANQAGGLSIAYTVGSLSAASVREATCPTEVCDSFSASHSVVATGAWGFVSIATGVDGLPLISFAGNATTTSSDLVLVHCANLQCTSSTSASVSTGVFTGWYSTITIGADGFGVVAFRDQSNGNLEVAHCANLTCSTVSRTLVDEFDDQANNGNGITVGADGLPLVTYFDQANKTLKVAHCADVACSTQLVAPF